MHGGKGSGRPPSTGKFLILPQYLESYADRLEDPTLKTLEHETAIIEQMTSALLQEAAEHGFAKWGEASAIVREMQEAYDNEDNELVGLHIQALATACATASNRQAFEDRLRDLFADKATLIEKGAKIEDRLGAVVDARTFLGLIAWFVDFVSRVAEKHAIPNVLIELKAELARKGAFAHGNHDRSQAERAGFN